MTPACVAGSFSYENQPFSLSATVSAMTDGTVLARAVMPRYSTGTVALGAFGHVVEMVPRTLFVDFREVAWGSETNMTLWPESKPSPERLKIKNQQWNGR